eukprot:5591006-Amphidinium_carterae.1
MCPLIAALKPCETARSWHWWNSVRPSLEPRIKSAQRKRAAMDARFLIDFPPSTCTGSVKNT